MRQCMLRSSGSTQLNDKIPTVPFRLNPECEAASSEFEVVYLHEGELFRYGFGITKEKVISDWLFYRPQKKKSRYSTATGRRST